MKRCLSLFLIFSFSLCHSLPSPDLLSPRSFVFEKKCFKEEPLCRAALSIFKRLAQFKEGEVWTAIKDFGRVPLIAAYMILWWASPKMAMWGAIVVVLIPAVLFFAGVGLLCAATVSFLLRPRVAVPCLALTETSL